MAGVTAGMGLQQCRAAGNDAPPTAVTVTFNKDIAPIVFKNCAGCHRPGQVAPFNLLTWAEVKKHAREIVEVTERHYMPPWLPEPGHGDFADARRLSADEISLIRRWVESGAVEGNRADLPPEPTWPGDWQLGRPDLVVKMPRAYTVPAGGKDIYRNFVIPIPITAPRFVRAVEFRPGNRKVVHHAFFKFDPTRESRHRDEADPAPGFEGIHAVLSAQPPPGHFLSWQPGKIVSPNEDGLAWRLEAGSDLVIETHLRPTGKPEQLQSEAGFYFTDQVPTNTPVKIWLNSYAIDIPAGKKDFVLEQSYRLPADADAIAVLPHAHYLGKELQARATLPDGTKKWLIDIKDWDFNWQGDYRYAHPLFLPEGTIIEMRYTYDNSADNPRNPHQPPERVRYGLQSTDEMGELWLQLLPRTAEGLQRIVRDSESRLLEDSIAYNQYLLRLDPRDAKAAVAIGKAMLLQGRTGEAVEQFHKAAQMQPGYDEPHYYSGIAFRLQNKIVPARTEFETALRLNPGNSKAHGNLGMIFAEQGDANMAETHFREALRIDPGDTLARDALDELIKAKAAPGPKK